MGTDFYAEFHYDKWLGCAKLQMAPLAIRGFWIQMIAGMMQGETDRISDTIGGIMRLAGCSSESEAQAAICEIKRRKIADVIRDEDGVTITIISRLQGRIVAKKRKNRDSTRKCRDKKKREAPPPKPARKKPAKVEAPKPKTDPLGSLPLVAAAFPEICYLFNDTFPDAKHRPVVGPEGHRQRDELRKIVKIDGMREDDLVETVRWWLSSTEEDAEFWRSGRCTSIMTLRKDKGSGTKVWQMNRKRLSARNPRGGSKVSVLPTAQDRLDASTGKDGKQ